MTIIVSQPGAIASSPKKNPAGFVSVPHEWPLMQVIPDDPNGTGCHVATFLRHGIILSDESAHRHLSHDTYLRSR